MKSIRYWSALALAGALIGCATTGDPNQGGLFGWSENKAQSRLDNLHSRSAEADRRLDHTQREVGVQAERSASLHEQIARLQLEFEALESAGRRLTRELAGKSDYLDRLLNERARLRNRVQAALKRQLTAREITSVRREIRELKRLHYRLQKHLHSKDT